MLIIEDMHDAAGSLQEALDLVGHVVAVAYDGPSGLALARDFHPDAVLCDIGLPVMNGFEVARAMRSDSAIRSAFLVALSGYALQDDIDKAKEAGFDEHMAKPPRLDVLERLLARIATLSPPDRLQVYASRRRRSSVRRSATRRGSL